MQTDPSNPRVVDDEPTTEEALPGVTLRSGDETHEHNRETLGPEAIHQTDAMDGTQGDEP